MPRIATFGGLQVDPNNTQNLSPLEQYHQATLGGGGAAGTTGPAGDPSVSGGGTSTSSFGQGYAFDPRVGNGALPPGIQGSANRAYTRSVQGNELTQDQLSGLLSGDSRYVQEARTRGREGAAARGLGVLGGMGAGLAEREAIRAALPIAESDAGAYRSAAAENLNYLNQMALQGQRHESLAGRGAGTDEIDLLHAARQYDLQMQREELAFDGEQRGLDRSHNVYRDERGYGQDRYRMANDRWMSRSDQRHDMAMQRQRTADSIRDYAARTGVDIHAQGALFTRDLLNGVMTDPDIFTPEFVGAMSQFAFDAFDDTGAEFDAWFDDFDFWGGY
jgi:hypothetical protein